MADRIGIRGFYLVMDKIRTELLSNSNIKTCTFGDITDVDTIIAHNIEFDKHILFSELHRYGYEDTIAKLKKINTKCTMALGKNHTKIEGTYGYKNPKLKELYNHFFHESYNEHNALDDVNACSRCYFKIKNNIDITN